jgi:hypothetical protein
MGAPHSKVPAPTPRAISTPIRLQRIIANAANYLANAADLPPEDLEISMLVASIEDELNHIRAEDPLINSGKAAPRG